MEMGFKIGDWVMLDPKHPSNVPGDEIFDIVGNRVREVFGPADRCKTPKSYRVDFTPDKGESMHVVETERLLLVMDVNNIPKDGDKVVFNDIHPENVNPDENDWYPELKDRTGEVLHTWKVEAETPKKGVLAGKIEFLNGRINGMFTYELSRFKKA